MSHVDDATLNFWIAHVDRTRAHTQVGVDEELSIRRELLTLRGIVRDAAETPPTLETGEWMHNCGYCFEMAGYDLELHAQSCPDRRAVEWVKEQDAGK